MTRTRTPTFRMELFHGRHKTIRLTIRDEEEQVVPLTGTTIEYSLAAKQGAPALATLSTGSGAITIVEANNGRANIAILDTTTDSLPNKSRMMYHECVLTDASGNEKPVFVGVVDFRASTIST